MTNPSIEELEELLADLDEAFEHAESVLTEAQEFVDSQGVKLFDFEPPPSERVRKSAYKLEGGGTLELYSDGTWNMKWPSEYCGPILQWSDF